MNRTLEPFGQFNVKAFNELKEKSVRFISALVKLIQQPMLKTAGSDAF